MTGPSQLLTERLGAPPEQVEEPGADESLEVAGRTPWELFSERFRRDKVAVVALGFIAVEILLAVFAPVIVRAVAHPPNNQYPEALDPQFGASGRSSNRSPRRRRDAVNELLVVRDLVKHFVVNRGVLFGGDSALVHAVDGVSFDVRRGETLGLVGDTGCGKTKTARLITRLIEPTSGQIVYDGLDITHSSRRRLRPVRREVQMIFQDPYSSLNPRRPVGAIIAEPLRIHGIGTRAERRWRVAEVMERVGLHPEHYNRYPHEFSGGQRQRIGIARAIVTSPKLIVADEPVSALDVSIQAQVLNLLQDLRDDLGLTLVFISHDLSVVRHLCDRVAVMYLGKIVELADPDRLYAQPKHPYTGALLSAVPVPSVASRRTRRLVLQGDVPSPTNPPRACRFHTRCPKAQELCSEVEPPLEPKGSAGQLAACHFPLTRGEAADLLRAERFRADSGDAAA